MKRITKKELLDAAGHVAGWDFNLFFRDKKRSPKQGLVLSSSIRHGDRLATMRECFLDIGIECDNVVMPEGMRTGHLDLRRTR